MKRYPVYMDSQQNGQLEARVTAALEWPAARREEVVIPAGFAARVAAQLPALKPARRPVPAVRIMAVLAAIACVVALAWLAPHAAPSFTSISFDLELLLFMQLAAIAYWFTTRHEA